MYVPRQAREIYDSFRRQKIAAVDTSAVAHDAEDEPRLSMSVAAPSESLEVVQPTDGGHALIADERLNNLIIQYITPGGTSRDAPPFTPLPPDSLLSLSHFVVDGVKPKYASAEPMSDDTHFKRYLKTLVVMVALTRFFRKSSVRIYFDLCSHNFYSSCKTPFLDSGFDAMLAPVDNMNQFSDEATQKNVALTNYLHKAMIKVNAFWNDCHAQGCSLACTLYNTIWYVSSGYHPEYARHWSHCAQLLVVDFTRTNPEWYQNHYAGKPIGGGDDNILWNGYLGSVYRLFSMRQSRPMTLPDGTTIPGPEFIQIRDCHQTATSYGDIEHTEYFNNGDHCAKARYEFHIPLLYTPLWAYTEFDKSVPSPIMCYVNGKRLKSQAGAGMIMPDSHYAASIGYLWRPDAISVLAEHRHFRDECRFGMFNDVNSKCYVDKRAMKSLIGSDASRYKVAYATTEHKIVHDSYIKSMADAHRYFDYGIDEILLSIGTGYFTSDTVFKPAFEGQDAVIECLQGSNDPVCDTLPLLSKEHRAYHDNHFPPDPNPLSRQRISTSQRVRPVPGSMLDSAVLLTMPYGWGILNNEAIGTSIRADRTSYGFFFPHSENKHNMWTVKPNLDNLNKVFPHVPETMNKALIDALFSFLEGEADREMIEAMLETLSPERMIILVGLVADKMKDVKDGFFDQMPYKQQRVQKMTEIFLAEQSNMYSTSSSNQAGTTLANFALNTAEVGPCTRIFGPYEYLSPEELDSKPKKRLPSVLIPLIASLFDSRNDHGAISTAERIIMSDIYNGYDNDSVWKYIQDTPIKFAFSSCPSLSYGPYNFVDAMLRAYFTRLPRDRMWMRYSENQGNFDMYIDSGEELMLIGTVNVVNDDESPPFVSIKTNRCVANVCGAIPQVIECGTSLFSMRTYLDHVSELSLPKRVVLARRPDEAMSVALDVIHDYTSWSSILNTKILQKYSTGNSECMDELIEGGASDRLKAVAGKTFQGYLDAIVTAVQVINTDEQMRVVRDKPVVVFRGTKYIDLNGSSDTMFHNRRDYVIHNPTPCSTSLKASVANGFSQRCSEFLVLEIPVGFKHAVYCDGVSAYPAESEVLLAPGCKFRIKEHHTTTSPSGHLLLVMVGVVEPPDDTQMGGDPDAPMLVDVSDMDMDLLTEVVKGAPPGVFPTHKYATRAPPLTTPASTNWAPVPNRMVPVSGGGATSTMSMIGMSAIVFAMAIINSIK